MIKHAMRLVPVLLAASLVFSCGGENPDPKSSAQAKASKSLAAEAVQCSDVATIAAGAYHTVGLKSDGTVVAVGYNRYGQLDVSTWTKIKAIAAGGYHTVGLKEDGTVEAAGYNGNGQLNVLSWGNIKALAAGGYHTVGLKDDGTVTAAGANSYGQLNVSTWTNIKAVAAGGNHTVGLREDGTVVAVGANSYGQLNVSTWTNVKAIAAGTNHTVGLKKDGTVVAVGNNSYGQLNVSLWTNIKAVSAGAYHTVGLGDDGIAVAAGYNDYSQLNVSNWTNIKAVAAGAYHTVGLKGDGTAVAVGYNGSRQLEVSVFADIMPVCEEACDPDPDVTPPATAAVLTGSMGRNGWYVSDVQMTLTATDNEGGVGVKEIYCSIDGAEAAEQGNTAVYSISGTGAHAVAYYAIDHAANAEAPHQMSVMIDKTPPVVRASLSPSPNANGWNNTDVTVTFTCSDSLSGIESCPAPITVATEGSGQVIIDTAVDKAGNTATASVTVNIDKTAPSAPSLSASPSVLWPPNHAMMNVLIAGSASDNGSGIASTTISVADEYGVYNTTLSGFGSRVPLESWRTGADKDGRHYTITAVTTDKAGNQSTATATVLVPHDRDRRSGKTP